MTESGITDRNFSFSLADAANYYTDKLIHLLANTLEPDLPDALRGELLKRVHAAKHEHGSIGWEFVSMTGHVWDGIDPSQKRQYEDFVYRVVGQAPHAGFIPDQLHLHPIYMNDVAQCIKLWRGRHLLHDSLVEERTFELGNGFSFSDYVECLCQLPLDAIRKLARCDAAVAFRRLSEEFAKGTAHFGELQSAYRDYRRRIDSEILKVVQTIRPSGGKVAFRAFRSEVVTEGRTQGINYLIDELVQGGIPLWKFGFSAFKRLTTGEWPRQKIERESAETASQNLNTQMHELQCHDNRIRSKILGANTDAVDRVVEMRWDDQSDICVGET